MSHPNDDQLLLLAYGELDSAATSPVEAHLAACPACRARLERLERARTMVEWTGPRVRRLSRRWVVGLGLAAAAVLAAVLLVRVGSPANEVDGGWSPPTVWSTTAGYIAGGATVVQIDAQLTRLEQERYYGLPD